MGMVMAGKRKTVLVPILHHTFLRVSLLLKKSLKKKQKKPETDARDTRTGFYDRSTSEEKKEKKDCEGKRIRSSLLFSL